ncbi:hypothetical protein GZL_04372 [Streptomyces sp. 769]|nr:hypothetical protein GZL_04372 [Streptomyces sp. 769]
MLRRTVVPIMPECKTVRSITSLPDPWSEPYGRGPIGVTNLGDRVGCQWGALVWPSVQYAGESRGLGADRVSARRDSAVGEQLPTGASNTDKSNKSSPGVTTGRRPTAPATGASHPRRRRRP